RSITARTPSSWISHHADPAHRRLAPQRVADARKRAYEAFEPADVIKALAACGTPPVAQRMCNSEHLFGQIAKISHAAALIPPTLLHQLCWLILGATIQERVMHDLVKWVAAAALGMGASIGTAAAADVPPPYPPPPRYSQPQPPPPPEYYPPQPRQERYGYEERYYQEPAPPPAYAYPPAPPAPVYGYYEPGPVVLPPPVYSYPYYPYRRHFAY